MNNKLLRGLAIGSGTDSWGWAMGCWFSIAAEAWKRNLEIPHQWKYQPGASNDPRDPESYEYAYCIEASDDELIEAGNILERYLRLLKKQGYDY